MEGERVRTVSVKAGAEDRAREGPEGIVTPESQAESGRIRT